MEKEQLKAKVAELKQTLDGMSTSEVCVVVDALFTAKPDFLQAVVGAIWHIGEGLNAAKAEIKPTKKGIGLNFVAKRGESLFIPEKGGAQ